MEAFIMAIETILDIIYVLGGAIAVAVPMVIKLIKAIRARKEAQTEAEIAKADAAIMAQIKVLVQSAETAFKQIDGILKQQNSSAGLLKKREVMNSLKSFCLEKGYAWDEAKMDDAVEAEVKYTKTVNAKDAQSKSNIL